MEPRICLGGIKKMVVWEVSSKGGRHCWNKDFAWDALRKLVLGGLFWGWPRPWNHGFCLGGVEETGVWKSLLE